MVKTRKYIRTYSKVTLTPKELNRASDDGIVIIVRPQAEGTWGVFAVTITGDFRGVNWYEVDSRQELSAAITLLNRDLDKFHGLGSTMSARGRSRPGEKKYYMSIQPKCGQITDVDRDTGDEQHCTNAAKYMVENMENWLVCEECLQALLKEEVITPPDNYRPI